LPGRRRFCRTIGGAGCSTTATTLEAMNRADLTAVPVRVTSLISTVPREVVTSTRRPAFVASISYFKTPFPESTTTSTRSPLMFGRYCYRTTRRHSLVALARHSQLAMGSRENSVRPRVCLETHLEPHVVRFVSDHAPAVRQLIHDPKAPTPDSLGSGHRGTPQLDLGSTVSV
jgi:hypothetical protein